MSREGEGYDPSYRENIIDEKLNEYGDRITRLERIALIGIGYGLAEGGTVAADMVQLI